MALPPWLCCAQLAMAVGRSVCSSSCGVLSPPQLVARSIGMGGTMSMLHWAVAYDPIVEGVSRACGVHTPTFVDDLAATTVGPRHTVATELFLVATAHCAGLLLEGHQCEWLECDSPPRALPTPSGPSPLSSPAGR